MREALRTRRGSKIQRSKFGVGKAIGGCIYVHKDYATKIIPRSTYKRALQLLYLQFPEFDFNVVKYDPDNNKISFMTSEDFDTAREPVVGTYIVVDVGSGKLKMGHSNAIYHHKWLWVDDNYPRFDVDKSYEWSKAWLSVLDEPADGTNIDRWKAQLAKYGLK